MVIQSPVATGQWIELPYYAGSRYVAYKPSQTDQVNFTIKVFLIVNTILFKMLSAYQYPARPQFLIHHINGFHVMDIKVFCIVEYKNILKLIFVRVINVIC